MHHIVKNDYEAQRYVNTIGVDTPLFHKSNRYVSALVDFFRQLWSDRTKGMVSEQGELDVVYWGRRDEEDMDYNSPVGGFLNSYWQKPEDYPKDNLHHHSCLYTEGDTSWSVYTPTQYQAGDLLLGWRPLSDVLDQADVQFENIRARILRIQQIVEANHGSFYVYVHAYSGGGVIRTEFHLNWEFHVYDPEESCPYYAAEPAGAAEE